MTDNANTGTVRELWFTLFQDVEECREALKVNDTQFGRRNYIRAVFAMIEAYTYVMKQDSLRVYKLLSDFRRLKKATGSTEETSYTELSLGDYTVLQEKNFYLTDKGRVGEAKAKLSLLPNVLYSFRVFAETHQIDFKLDISGNGWDSLRKAVQIRNRITHPKETADLTITDEEAEFVIIAWAWFFSNVHNVYGKFRDKERTPAT